ncbi:MAG: SUMF1/EgtB/PvdO family nonheme iron enzyme [Verrucomicrobia bacterium]|nr:SUMF1/EgtB/PvdO family nonheme iron enzyme [Verrucomicrobiota bacterium]
MNFRPLLLSCLLAATASAADRVALVIGNDAYRDFPLDNAVKDATAVRDLLSTRLGFQEADLVVATNADRVTVYESLEAFKRSAREAKILVVYYAGHGMESLDGKENFLLPVDTDIAAVAKSEAVLRAAGVNMMTLAEDLAAVSSGAKVILMDCCRERPAGRGAKPRAGGGLVTYEDGRIPADTLMLLAAAPERIASDGDGHGPFTLALLEELPVPGRSLFDTFFSVSDRVQALTENQQVPWLKFDGSAKIFRDNVLLASAGPAPVRKPAPLPTIPVVAMPEPGTPTTASRDRPFENSLGMKFVPVVSYTNGKKVLFSVWETRVRDFRAYRTDTEGEPDHPVVNVSWEDAVAFCEWLSRRDGKTYRLPTDHEWSLAVGIGERESATASPRDKDMKIEGVYPWGTTWPPPRGAGNYDSSLNCDAFEQTAPVGSFSPNRFGLYDLGGNVLEWCSDWSDRDQQYRVLRGGSWNDDVSTYLLSSNRYIVTPSNRYVSRGFRVVLEVGSGG